MRQPSTKPYYHCAPGARQPWSPSPLEIIANKFNRWTLEENLKRVRFFANGSYSYKPSQAYIHHIGKFAKKHSLIPIVNEF